MTIQWFNLGINVAVCVCCGLAAGGIMGLIKGEGRLWVAGFAPPIGMLIGVILAVNWPIVR